MPRYMMKRIYEFVPTDSPNGDWIPPDLLDDRGVIFKLAWWPQAPLELTADNEDEALQRAHREWQSAGCPIFRDARISKERFEQFKAQPRPGQEDRFTCLIAHWIMKAADAPADDPWIIATFENFTPAPAPESAPATT